MGACGVGELDSGTTTTVRRSSLTVSRLSTTQGRVLAISEPGTGSRATHQTSPRRGMGVLAVTPGLFDFILYPVPFFSEGGGRPVPIRRHASPREIRLLVPQALLQGLDKETGTLSSRHTFHQRAAERFRHGEGHLSASHTPLLAREL